MTNRQFKICLAIHRKWSLRRILKKFSLDNDWDLQSELDDLKLDPRSTLNGDDPIFLDARSQAAFEEFRRERCYQRIPVMISIVSVVFTFVSALVALAALQLSSIQSLGRTLSLLEILGLLPH